MKRIGSYRALFADFDDDERDRLINDLAQERGVNAFFLLLIAVLSTLGLILLYSSGIIQSYNDSDTGSYQSLIIRQTVLSAVGIIIALAIAFLIKINFLDKAKFAFLTYFFTTGLLISVPVIGTVKNGAKRWIGIGPIEFQPSEIAKFATVFILAYYFSRLKRKMPLNILRYADSKVLNIYANYYIVYPAVAIGLWIGLVVMQPHLSGAILMILLAFSMFIAVGIPGRLWARGLLRILPLVLVLIIAAAVFFPLVKKQSLGQFIEEHFVHVKTRTAVFTADDDTQNDSNYQVIQSRIALGAGGLTGLGLGNSRQKFNYLPAIHNDYIFSGIGEELGFLGCTALVILFLLLFITGVYISTHTNSLFASLIAWGYTFLLTIQALLNMAVTTEIIPATGISLPFFSYGGTANIVFLVEAGMILAVSRSAQKKSDIITKTLNNN